MLMFVVWSFGFRSRLSLSTLKMEAVPISKGKWHQESDLSLEITVALLKFQLFRNAALSGYRRFEES
jgi:hypothetical protein